MKAEYRNIDTSPGSSFRASFFEDTEFPAAWHFHPQYELTYILKSTGIRYVGDSIQNFEPGDLVLVGSNLPHCWMTVGEQTDNVQCIIIQWNTELLGDWLNKPEMKSIIQLLQKSQRGIRFSSETARTLEIGIIQLTQKPPFERLLGLLQILQKLASIEAQEPLASGGYNNAMGMDQSGRINLLYNFVRENHLRQITLEEVAASIKMGREAFCRFFKKTFNKSFFTFVNEYKVNLASKLLIDSDLSVSQIGYDVGYNNLTFFHRQFAKFMHMSPSKYRNAYQRIPV